VLLDRPQRQTLACTTTLTLGRPDRFRSLIASALVALQLGVSLGPVLHEGVGHDTDCEPILVLHDAGQHRIGAARASTDALPQGDHCVVCHLFRGSRSSDSSSGVVQRDIETSLVACTDTAAALTPSIAVPLPARAPPARS
jgi:hypothetical protein